MLLSNVALDVFEPRPKSMAQMGTSSRRAKPLSDGGFADMLKAVGVDAVPHGIRSSFADWAAENRVAHAVKEAALAHTAKNAVEAPTRAQLP